MTPILDVAESTSPTIVVNYSHAVQIILTTPRKPIVRTRVYAAAVSCLFSGDNVTHSPADVDRSAARIAIGRDAAMMGRRDEWSSVILGS